MASKTLVYKGSKIAVTYDVKRCIHAAECVRGLPEVFDVSRKPWVDPEAAPPEDIAKVIQRCPSGALHYQRSDGGTEESAPGDNRIKLAINGPLHFRGDLRIVSADGQVVMTDTRMSLCRCGASQNKPFCDGSHVKVHFQDSGSLGTCPTQTEAGSQEGGLTIAPLASGPLAVKGAVALVSGDGLSSCQGNKLFLCRCGSSKNKPFCDGTHGQVGFVCD